MTIFLFLQVLGCVFFFVAAINIPVPRVAMGWLGAFCWSLSLLLVGVR